MKRKLIIFILIAVCIFALAACDKEEGKNDATSSPTPVPTPTAEPTEAPTPAPTKEPLPEGELGLPSEKSEVIYFTDFSDDDIEGNLLIQNGEFSITNGKFYLCSKDGGETWASWGGLTPDFACYPSEAHQWEFHLEFQSTYPAESGDAPWMATIIGARVCNYLSSIADTDDGIWVGFTERDSITVYPSGSNTEKYWPAGAVKVNIPEGFGDMKKLVLVDTGESIFYYMNTAEEETVLILRIDISEEEIKVFNGEGNEVYKTDNYLDMQEGNHFKIFNHMAATVIGSLAIKEY